MIQQIYADIRARANQDRAQQSARFFKCGPGEYAHHDVFLGITVPQARLVAKKYMAITLEELAQLIRSKYHEERLIALLILVYKFEKTKSEGDKEIIVEFYLNNVDHVNNWDLVDTSAYKILGPYLAHKDKSLLTQLAHSSVMWHRRIAIITTYHFIKYQKQAETTLELAKLLLNDRHDLMHKAVGWMLREVGKHIDRGIMLNFLKAHHASLPRTSLRYALEHCSQEEKSFFFQ